MSAWARRWRDVIAGDGPLAQRGAVTQRSGRVTDLRWAPGRLSARVQGAGATPYLVEIAVPVLTDADWERIVSLIAGTARYGARMLAGQAPDGLDEQLAAQGIELYPATDAVRVDCGCGQGSGLCRHGAAVWEAAATVLETDPLTLFRLRGRGQQRLLRAVADARRRHAGAPPEPPGLALGELAVEGWTRGRVHRLHLPAPPAPVSAAADLRVLGDPPGWEGALSAYDLFAPLVTDAAARARAVGCEHG